MISDELIKFDFNFHGINHTRPHEHLLLIFIKIFDFNDSLIRDIFKKNFCLIYILNKLRRANYK